ncbi:MAG: hypothetical protein IKL00_09245 [Oscillospiraceae bacterium]|nr:hypothetical protein [Oscillospiraceae bacterium]
MKTKARILAPVLSAVCLLCMMPMGAGATNYDCDVNGDGSEDILDSIALNRYLMGQYYVSDPSVMDVNGNLIVDVADSYCIMACVTDCDYSHIYIYSIENLKNSWGG